jgi:hypothetical protein
MLRPQARIFAAGTNTLDARWLSSDGRKRQRGAQYLPSAFSVRAVNGYHLAFG